MEPKDNSTKGIGGRKKKDPSFKLECPVKSYLTQKEYEELFSVFESSGMQSFAAFLRTKLTQDKSMMLNPIEFLKKLDAFGAEINRIGNNINQIAKHGNTMAKNNQLKPELIENFNRVMEEYLGTRTDFITVFRQFMRKI